MNFIRLRVGLVSKLFAALVILCPLALGQRVWGQQRSLETSLQIVPQDVAFYWASMNHAAIWENVTDSEAYRRLQETPLAVKLRNGYRRGRFRGWDQFGTNPLRYYLEGWAESIDSPTGQLIMPFLKQLIGNEVFLYGDDGWVRWRNGINAAYIEMAPVMNEMQRTGSEDFGQIWPIISRHVGDLQLPTLVCGAFVDEPDAFSGMIELAAQGLQQSAGALPPDVAFLVEDLQVKRGEDAIEIHWSLRGDQIPWELMEESPDFQELIPTLQELCDNKQLAIAVGVRGHLLYLSVGPSNEHLERLGSGPLLIDRAELQAVRSARSEGKQLTGVGFMSAEEMSSGSGLAGLVSMVPLGIEQMMSDPSMAHIDSEVRHRLLSDVYAAAEEFAAESRERTPARGSYVSYSFLQPEGIEGYLLEFGRNDQPGSSGELAVSRHVGAEPALIWMERAEHLLDNYRFWRGWVSRAFQLSREYAPYAAQNPRAAMETKQLFDKIQPLAARLDQIIDQQILPQIDGKSLALVIDLSHRRSSWFGEMPEFGPAVPIPAVALAIAIEDPRQMQSAGAELFALADSVLSLIREMDPSVPEDTEIPRPVEQVVGDTVIYRYALPAEVQADQDLVPHLRMSDQFLFFGFVQTQTEDMAGEHQPQRFGPAAQIEGAASVGYYDHAQWVDAAAGWVSYVFAAAEASGESIELAGGGESDLLDMNRSEIEQTWDVWYEVCKCFHGYSTRSEIVDGVRQTHYLWRFDDLPADE